MQIQIISKNPKCREKKTVTTQKVGRRSEKTFKELNDELLLRRLWKGSFLSRQIGSDPTTWILDHGHTRVVCGFEFVVVLLLLLDVLVVVVVISSFGLRFGLLHWTGKWRWWWCSEGRRSLVGLRHKEEKRKRVIS